MKHMTLHRATFDTHEVISPHNVQLGHNSVAKTIRMGSIVIGVETRGTRTRIRITDVLHVPKLQVNLLFHKNVNQCGLKRMRPK